MQTALTIVLVVAMVGTVITLGLGLVQMARGSADAKRSNTLMQYRVVFQAVAVVVFIAVLMLMRG